MKEERNGQSRKIANRWTEFAFALFMHNRWTDARMTARGSFLVFANCKAAPGSSFYSWQRGNERNRRAKNFKWFWPGKVDDRFSGLANDKRIDLFANLFAGHSAEACTLRHGSRKKLPSDSTTRNPLPVSRPLLSLIPSTRLSILSFPSPLAQIHPGLFITQ